MVAISALRKYLTSAAAGVSACPSPTMDFAIRKAARELCQKTNCWREDRETTSMRDGRNEVAIDTPGCTDIVSVEYLSFDDRELTQTTDRWLSAHDCDWRNTEGDPVRYVMNMADRVARLYPTPNRSLSRSIKYRVFVMPTLDATSLADILQDQFISVLVDGAVYELLSMNGKPWSDPPEGQRRRGLFRDGIYTTRDKVQQMYASQNLDMLPEPLV